MADMASQRRNLIIGLTVGLTGLALVVFLRVWFLRGHSSAGLPPATASMMRAGDSFEALVTTYTTTELQLTAHYVSSSAAWTEGSSTVVNNTQQEHDYIGGVYAPNGMFCTCHAPQAKESASTADILGYPVTADGDSKTMAVMQYTPTDNQVLLYPASECLYQNTAEGYVYRVSTREQRPDP